MRLSAEKLKENGGWNSFRPLLVKLRMNATPILSNGRLERNGDSWLVRLDSSSPIFAENLNVKLVLWSDDSDGNESDVERVARIQQLPIEVVAVGLSSEGALLVP